MLKHHANKSGFQGRNYIVHLSKVLLHQLQGNLLGCIILCLATNQGVQQIGQSKSRCILGHDSPLSTNFRLILTWSLGGAGVLLLLYTTLLLRIRLHLITQNCISVGKEGRSLITSCTSPATCWLQQEVGGSVWGVAKLLLML